MAMYIECKDQENQHYIENPNFIYLKKLTFPDIGLIFHDLIYNKSLYDPQMFNPKINHNKLEKDYKITTFLAHYKCHFSCALAILICLFTTAENKFEMLFQQGVLT